MYYQLTYVIPSDVADPKTLEEVIADVNKKIADAGGIIKAPLAGTEDQMVMDKNAEDLEKIKTALNVRIFKHRLSYPIKHVSYGFYIASVYELPEKIQASAAKKLNAEIKLNKKIIRSVNTKYNFEVFSEQAHQKEKTKNIKVSEKIKEKEQKPIQPEIEKLVRKRKDVALDEKLSKDKKTEIEELDEKLEQILSA